MKVRKFSKMLMIMSIILIFAAVLDANLVKSIATIPGEYLSKAIRIFPFGF